MYKRSLLLLLTIILSISISASAQDGGDPDTVDMVITLQPDSINNHLTMQIQLWVFTDYDTINSCSMGFGWDNPKIQIVSATPSTLFENGFDNYIFYDAGVIDSTNERQRFQCVGIRFQPDTYIPPLSERRLWVTYNFTVAGDWTTGDIVHIDTLTYNFGTTYKFVGSPDHDYYPIWGGSVDIVDFPDYDFDGVTDTLDNCMYTYNPEQENLDGDLQGDSCDNCISVVNNLQEDTDTDDLGDSCDNCPIVYNPNQANYDGDTLGNACDNCPTVYNDSQNDNDSDAIGDLCDNCPNDYNPTQADNERDGLGDVCDPDDDNDGFPDLSDNCPYVFNLDQNDYDGNGIGDACDIDFNVSNGPEATPSCIRSIDLDYDNKIDLAFSILADTSLGVTYGNGDATFESVITYISNGASPFDLAFAFVNNDTLVDIVAADNEDIYILRNNGNRSFSSSSFPYEGSVPNSITSGFINDDKYIDIIVTPNNVFLGNSSGTFDVGLDVPVAFVSVDAGDFDNDGFDDIMIVIDNAYPALDSVQIFLNTGGGMFVYASGIEIGDLEWAVSTVKAPADFNNNGNAVSTVNALTDFNKDGNLDFAFIVPNATSTPTTSIVYLVLGDGEGDISDLDSITVYGTSENVNSVDADQDHHLDIITANATNSTFEIYLGDGEGNFGGMIEINMETEEMTYPLTSSDFDRDGNPDLISGETYDLYGEFLVATNRLPNKSLINYEMVTTGYSNVTLEVINPDNFSISQNFQTVAGADYLRYDTDMDGYNDDRVIDYNLMYGEYIIIIKARPEADPGALFCGGIRINGTKSCVLFNDYQTPTFKKSANSLSDSIVFYFSIDSLSPIQPYNGEAIIDTLPTFDWTGLIPGGSSPESYHFQLSPYYYFEDIKFDVMDISSPSYTVPEPLGDDTVYYWRIRSYENSQWSDFSRTFAAFVVANTDRDRDGILNEDDNCPYFPNQGQENHDSDSLGDACDNCILMTNDDQADSDNDGIGDVCDNCVGDYNPDQKNSDSDSFGNVCDDDDDNDTVADNEDNCQFINNPGQDDYDGDDIGDACDECTDTDGDQYGNPGFDNSACPTDNCPDIYNPGAGQLDTDSDGAGDVCDDDDDNDGILDISDNCPLDTNPDQLNFDGDEWGDICDPDDDNDGIDDDGDGSGEIGDNYCAGGATSGCDDNCTFLSNSDQADNDNDGVGNACDNCPDEPNSDQDDSDDDGIGDACEPDDDDDGILDVDDNCRRDYNPEQENSDADDFGDSCDNCPFINNPDQQDMDNDLVGDICDNCPYDSNYDQSDNDKDGVGNACCCIGYTGNVNCSELEEPDISDITRLIDYLYISGNILYCPDEADANGSGGEPDISDITRLIDYLYISHAPLISCS